MKIAFFLFLFIQCCCIVSAQTVQNGIIQEYNGAMKKKPLSGVELNVRSAGSTVSDNDGSFELHFLSLKPGEKVNVRRIEKLGYEVFNKEAVEQWNINPSAPFVIVMCRSDVFKQIRDNYEKVSSQSYARQAQREEEQLKKLKEDGKIQEAEYQQQLYKLREEYERQLDDLETYVDRFSRIDLSEISSVEQEIIALVQQGRIDEAIAKYEQQDYVSRYSQEVEDIKEVSAAIDQLVDVKQEKKASADSLLAAIDRQIETLQLAGGKDNFNRIGVILHDVAYADTLNVANMRKYADFLYHIKDYEEAYKFYLKLRNDNMDKDAHLVRNRIALLDKDFGRYDLALQRIDSMESQLQSLPNKEEWINEIIGLYLNKSLVYSKKGDINEEMATLEYALSLNAQNNCDPLLVASVKNSLCNIYTEMKNFDAAYTLYMEVLETYTTHDDGNENAKERLAGVLLNISQLYRDDRKLDEAKIYIKQSIDNAFSIYQKNPNRYADLYCNVLITAGNIYSDDEQLDTADAYYAQALEAISDRYQQYPTVFWRQYVDTMANRAILEESRLNHAVSNDYFRQCIAIIRSIPESNNRNRHLSMTLYNLSYIYCIMEEFDTAVDLLVESMDYTKRLFKYNKRYAASSYMGSLNNLAYCYDKLKRYDDAKALYKNGMEILEELQLANTNPFDLNYANMNYNLGHHVSYIDHNPNEAIPLYLTAYKIYEAKDMVSDIIDTAVGLAVCYLDKDKLKDAQMWLSKVAHVDQCNSHVGYLHTSGLIAYHNGDLALAREYKERILAVDPDVDTSDMELFKLKLE